MRQGCVQGKWSSGLAGNYCIILTQHVNWYVIPVNISINIANGVVSFFSMRCADTMLLQETGLWGALLKKWGTGAVEGHSVFELRRQIVQK